ncbi:hypothetical protein ACNPNP_19615 [Microbacterium sp. AGC85]
MNLLSTIMPGIREARTPLAVGVLWLIAAYMAVVPPWGDTLENAPGIRWLASQLNAIPQVYLVGGLAFASYLVGAALQPLSTLLARRLLKPFTDAQRGGYPQGKIRRAFFRLVRRRVDVSEYLGPVNDAITQTYVAAGLPSMMAIHYPHERVVAKFDATALQLWNSHPDQYQEYDRLRAERDFRQGIWLPILVIGIACGPLFSWWATVGVAIGALVLLYQSWGTDHRRIVLIANALFQNLVEDAELTSMVQNLAALKRPRNWRETESVRCALTAVAFAKVGDFEYADELTWEAAAVTLSDAIPELHYPDAEVDIADARSRRAISAVAKQIRSVYRANDEADEIPVYDGRLKKHLKDAGKESA